MNERVCRENPLGLTKDEQRELRNMRNRYRDSKWRTKKAVKPVKPDFPAFEYMCGLPRR